MATADTTRTAAEVARSYFEALAAKDLDRAADHRSPEVVADIVPVGILRGPEEYRALFEEMFAAFPDFELVIEDVVGGDTTAAVRWRWSGTHSGSPFQGIEPTDRRVETRTVDWIELDAEGRIVRVTAYFDGMEVARGMGMMPPKDSSAERAMRGAFNGVTKVRSAIAERRGA